MYEPKKGPKGLDANASTYSSKRKALDLESLDANFRIWSSRRRGEVVISVYFEDSDDTISIVDDCGKCQL